MAAPANGSRPACLVHTTRGGDEPIVVIGRGILGATTALRLAHAGRRVTVVGSSPTSTNLAFGWLGGHRPASSLFHVLNRLSRQAWESLLDLHLGREGYVGGGCLKYAADASPAGVPRLQADAELFRGRGHPTHSLDPEAVEKLVPELAGIALAAVHHPDDAVIDGGWAARRALERAEQYGADVQQGLVTAFERAPHGSVTGVLLEDGTMLSCSSVVLAAGGKGNHELAGMLGVNLPIKGVWGIQLRTKPLARRLAPGVAMLKHFASDCGNSAGISYGQFPNNSFCINEKFVEGVDIELRLRHWLSFFANYWPELRSAEIAFMTKTVRWIPEDDNPICGFYPAPASNVYGMLTNSDGITMSALLSELAVAELCGGDTRLLPSCQPGRFGTQRSFRSKF
eukprot:TRINITY_DN54826_c0_g1_i1.p1 TRINITY_DN54826_c0_g1~~TRINITY_DN54826_c0_g1_i1.p1  ORF type:complete len:398 (-),score=42.70 TRINITY_DN54826_c0_g1_i1:236-1429(-)